MTNKFKISAKLLAIVIFTLALAPFLLGGCAKLNKAPIPEGVAAEFQPYVADYTRIKGEETGWGTYPVSIGFSTDVPMFAAAQCTKQGGVRWITVKEKYWNTLPDNMRKSLVYHELIHCDNDFFSHVEEIGHLMHPVLQSIPDPDQKLREWFRR